MTLVALTDTEPIDAASAQFCQHFDGARDVLEYTVGYQGGNEPATVQRFPALKFWARLYPQNQGNGYWCGFGIVNLHKVKNLKFTCEINPPYTGLDRQRAGLFVQSDNGTIYLAHSGGVAGGKPGVGRTAFLKYYGLETLDKVHWPDQQVTEHIIIAALDDPELFQQVAAFVYRVAEFKRLSEGVYSTGAAWR